MVSMEHYRKYTNLIYTNSRHGGIVCSARGVTNKSVTGSSTRSIYDKLNKC